MSHNFSFTIERMDEQVTPAEFKTVREALGFSAQWLADAVQVDQRTVRRWEDGVIPLRADVVDLLRGFDELVDNRVADITNQIFAELGADYLHQEERDDRDFLLSNLGSADWPTAIVPRVDDDLNAINQSETLLAELFLEVSIPLPAALYRAAAGRLYRELKGKVHINYIDAQAS